jgi:protein-tyrosine phosphatase
MAFESLPTRDRGFPPSTESASALFDRMADHLRAGRTVAVHCRFAMGRSPLVAACILVRLGKSAEEAIGLLSAARGCIVPQLPEQQDWVRAFAARAGPP